MERGGEGGGKEVAERRETVGEVGGNKVAAISSDKGRGRGGKEGRRGGGYGRKFPSRSILL